MKDGVLKKAFGGVEDDIAFAHNALMGASGGGEEDYEKVRFLTTMAFALQMNMELTRLLCRGLWRIDEGTDFGKALGRIRDNLNMINAGLRSFSDPDGYDEIAQKLGEIIRALIVLGDSVRAIPPGADSTSDATQTDNTSLIVMSAILAHLGEKLKEFDFFP